MATISSTVGGSAGYGSDTLTIVEPQCRSGRRPERWSRLLLLARKAAVCGSRRDAPHCPVGRTARALVPGRRLLVARTRRFVPLLLPLVAHVGVGCRRDPAIMRRWEPAGNDASSSPRQRAARRARRARPLATIRRAAAPMWAAAIATDAGTTCILLISHADLAVGPFVGPNPAVLGRTRPNARHLAARLFGRICRHFRARWRHERHASHARGRRFETRRAHPHEPRYGAVSPSSVPLSPGASAAYGNAMETSAASDGSSFAAWSTPVGRLLPALLPSPSAEPGGSSQGQPEGPSEASREAVPLTAAAGGATRRGSAARTARR
jgi:hypothetical protein